MTPSIPWIMTRTWRNHGGFAGGRYFDPENQYLTPISFSHVIDVTVPWWNGGRAPLGGMTEICAYIAPTTTPQVVRSGLWLRTFLSKPLAFPGIRGMPGVSPIVDLPIGTHTLTTGLARTTLLVPNNPALRGVVIPAQAYTVSNLPAYGVGNTAALTIL